MKIVCWFSCGAASAAATKLTLDSLALRRHGAEIVVARCVVANEHPDNDRFAADCMAWFGQSIVSRASTDYDDCWDVWEKRRYLAGIDGAPCTLEMKKVVRWAFEKEWLPDVQVFGFTSEEVKREARFKANNPDVRMWSPLIRHGVSKQDCISMVAKAGIEIPIMYRLGYANNNCIGCVKGGLGYWNKIRVDFPEVFDRMAKLERSIGATVCKLGSGKRERVYLDELSPTAGRHEPPQAMDCGLLCEATP